MQLRRVPEQHGGGARRHRAALPELADRPRLGPYFAHPVEPHLAKPGVLRDPDGERPDEAAVPAGGYPDAGGFLNVSA